MGVRYTELKEQLLADKARLEANIKNTATVSGARIGYGNHMADNASYAFEQAKSLSLQQNAKGVLGEINAALKRFEDGTYGVCVQCGQCIDPARLEAIPYASLCMTCAQGLRH